MPDFLADYSQSLVCASKHNMKCSSLFEQALDFVLSRENLALDPRARKIFKITKINLKKNLFPY